MCVSTGMVSRPATRLSHTSAVFGPMPGRSTRVWRGSGSSRTRMRSPPKRSTIFRATARTRGAFWRESPAGFSARARTEGGAFAIVSGRTATLPARSRITRSVTESVLFWLTTIETSTSNGCFPSAQFVTRNRRQRTSKARRNVRSSTPSPLHEGADHREDVPRALPQAAEEVREPLRAVRNVLDDAVLPRDEVPLQRIAHTLQELELPDPLVRVREPDRLLDQPAVVGRDREVVPLLEQDFEEAQVGGVDLLPAPVGNLLRLAVRALREANLSPVLQDPLEVLRRPPQVRLEADADAVVALVQVLAHRERVLREPGALHVDPQEVAHRPHLVEDRRHHRLAVRAAELQAELGRLHGDARPEVLPLDRRQDPQVLPQRPLDEPLLLVVLPQQVQDRVDAARVRVLRVADGVLKRLPRDPLVREADEEPHAPGRGRRGIRVATRMYVLSEPLAERTETALERLRPDSPPLRSRPGSRPPARHQPALLSQPRLHSLPRLPSVLFGEEVRDERRRTAEEVKPDESLRELRVHFVAPLVEEDGDVGEVHLAARTELQTQEVFQGRCDDREARVRQGASPTEERFVHRHLSDAFRVRVDFSRLPPLERVLRKVRPAMGEAGFHEARLERCEVPASDDDVDVVRAPVRRVRLNRDPADEQGAISEVPRNPPDDGRYVDATTSSYTLRRASGSRRRPGVRTSGNATYTRAASKVWRPPRRAQSSRRRRGCTSTKPSWSCVFVSASSGARRR